MNCPHCGMTIPSKVKGAEAKYREDAKKASAAILALERWQPDTFDLKTDGEYYAAVTVKENGREYSIMKPHKMTIEIRDAHLVGITAAIENEVKRLQSAITNPAKLYAIYRRADKKTPVAYGMEAT